MSFTVSIQVADFDLTKEIAELRANDASVGAVCSFVGTVREHERMHDELAGEGIQPFISSLELEHYPGMTERSIEQMMQSARMKFNINAARIVHRIGILQPKEQIVLVAVTSPHRGESFKACEYLMDYLKTQAPFWKKEQTAHGARWVDARVSDDQAMARWS